MLSVYIILGESSYFTRHLLFTSKWETCDFETDYVRNESSLADKDITPNSAYGWLALHIMCVIIIFVGNTNGLVLKTGLHARTHV